MAPMTRSFTATGVALVGVAAIAAATPVVAPGQVAGLPSSSTAQYRLAAANLQVPDLFVISQVGYGEVLGPDDPYYPGEFNNDVRLTGPNGLVYYVVDRILQDPYNLENYFFEVGAKSGNPIAGGLAAVAYVQTAALFGVDSLITQAVKAAVTGGNVGAAVASAITTAVSSLVYKLPVVGPIASVYVTGKAPGDPTEYGTGVNGVIAYAGKLIPALGFLLGPPRTAAAVAAAKTAAVAAAPADNAQAVTAPAESAGPSGTGDSAAPDGRATATSPRAAAAEKLSSRSRKAKADLTDLAGTAAESDSPESDSPDSPQSIEAPAAAEKGEPAETSTEPEATGPAAARTEASAAPKRAVLGKRLAQRAAKAAQSGAGKRAKAGRAG
ncbi:MAG: hypothetical protein ACKOQ4_13455 [Mycobacterium sp.]